MWSWKAGLTQAPQLHCMPAQLKEPKRALHPIHTSFSSTWPSCTGQSKTTNESIWSKKNSLGKGRNWLWLLDLTGFHPFHRFNKYRGAIGWFVLQSPLITTSLTPLEAWFTFSSFMGDYTLLRGNNSTTLFTTIYNLRIREGFWTWVIWFSHFCIFIMVPGTLVRREERNRFC